MHVLIYTNHFQKRARQRGINDVIVAALVQYGEVYTSKGGIDSLIFTKLSFIDIRNDYGTTVAKMCEKFKNTYIIMSDDGVLITVARSYRRTVH